jgi:hypothetical protein
MQKDVYIDRKKLPCNMFYIGKNKFKVRKMSKKIVGTLSQRFSRRKRKNPEEHVSTSSSSKE